MMTIKQQIAHQAANRVDSRFEFGDRVRHMKDGYTGTVKTANPASGEIYVRWDHLTATTPMRRYKDESLVRIEA